MNLGKWDQRYAGATRDQPVAYGQSDSYRLGAEALADCKTIEDWGCGLGWFRQYMPDDVLYVGVDGSWSPHADVVDDLVTRQTSVEGIFMRHVLEHNYDWPKVLKNVLASFTKRMVLVTFTPFATTAVDVELRFEEDYQVPTLSLSRQKLRRFLKPYARQETEIKSPATFYGHETVFVIEAL